LKEGGDFFYSGFFFINENMFKKIKGNFVDVFHTMIRKKSLYEIIFANSLSAIVPISLVLVMRDKFPANEYADFITFYSLALFFSGLVDLGSRNLFLTTSNLELEYIADCVKLFVSLIFSLLFCALVLFKGNMQLLFLTPFIFREVFFPYYKFKNNLKKYNFLLSISSFLVITAILFVIYFGRGWFFYLIFSLSLLPLYQSTHIKLNLDKLSEFKSFIKLSSNYAISSAFIGLMINGFKSFVGTLADSNTLINFELQTKIVNFGRIFVTSVVDYFQILAQKKSIKFYLFISSILQLFAYLSIFTSKLVFEYTSREFMDLLLLSNLIFPVTATSFIHKIDLILNQLSRIVLYSVIFGGISVFVPILIGFEISSTLLNISVVFSESVVLISTLLFFKSNKFKLCMITL